MDLNSMKNFIISIFFLTSFYSYSQECSSFYLIRHAEKLRIDKTERNPKLNEKGILRAEKWKEVLKSLLFDDMVESEVGPATDWTPGVGSHGAVLAFS